MVYIMKITILIITLMSNIVHALHIERFDADEFFREITSERDEPTRKAIKDKCRIQLLELKVCQLENVTQRSLQLPMRAHCPIREHWKGDHDEPHKPHKDKKTCDDYKTNLKTCAKTTEDRLIKEIIEQLEQRIGPKACIQRGWKTYCS